MITAASQRLDANYLIMVSIAHDYLETSSIHMQLEELPEDMRAALRDRTSGDAQAQAKDEYSRRFITRSPDASCLSAASSGQSATVTAALIGNNPFQVLKRCGS